MGWGFRRKAFASCEGYLSIAYTPSFPLKSQFNARAWPTLTVFSLAIQILAPGVAVSPIYTNAAA